MKILEEFEKRLEEIIEGFFKKRFQSGVHPKEIAKSLLREIEEKKIVGHQRFYSPSKFTIFLSPEDRKRFSEYEESILAELKDFVHTQATQKNYLMQSMPEIILKEDKSLVLGDFRIKSNKARVKLEEEVQEAALVLKSGKEESVFYLQKETNIGRTDENGIILPDPSVSHQHARIIKKDETFILEDLKSTNGSFINGRRVIREKLKDGDKVTIGSVNLFFKERS